MISDIIYVPILMEFRTPPSNDRRKTHQSTKFHYEGHFHNLCEMVVYYVYHYNAEAKSPPLEKVDVSGSVSTR